MPKPATIDAFYEDLWADLDSLDITPAQRAQIMRCRYIFTERLANPSLPNTVLVEALTKQFGISTAQAYRDISGMEEPLGKVRSADKAWARYLVLEVCKEAIEKARKKNDPKSMIKGAATIGKYMQLDREDAIPLPFDEIVPERVEFENDPSLLGLPQVENPREAIEKAKKRYLNIVDTDFEEVI